MLKDYLCALINTPEDILSLYNCRTYTSHTCTSRKHLKTLCGALCDYTKEYSLLLDYISKAAPSLVIMTIKVLVQY